MPRGVGAASANRVSVIRTRRTWSYGEATAQIAAQRAQAMGPPPGPPTTNRAASPPSDLARIIELVRLDKMDLAGAVNQAQREAQERQSTTFAPVDPGAPEAQPGLAAPGMGAEAGAVIPEPGASQDRFAQLLNQLRTTRTAGDAAERSVGV